MNQNLISLFLSPYQLIHQILSESVCNLLRYPAERQTDRQMGENSNLRPSPMAEVNDGINWCKFTLFGYVKSLIADPIKNRHPAALHGEVLHHRIMACFNREREPAALYYRACGWALSLWTLNIQHNPERIGQCVWVYHLNSKFLPKWMWYYINGLSNASKICTWSINRSTDREPDK